MEEQRRAALTDQATGEPDPVDAGPQATGSEPAAQRGADPAPQRRAPGDVADPPSRPELPDPDQEPNPPEPPD